MEDTNDIEQKQQYLREEILDKSYDIDEFSEFMSKYKENGTDLKFWEFSELKEAVKNFKNRAKEDESQKIERGVENIRQSFRFGGFENDKENTEENLDIDLQAINNNSNNNCVNNILNDYLKNKEVENEKINKSIKEENKEKNIMQNNNINSNLDNNLSNNNNINNKNEKIETKAEKNKNNSSILSAELDISKKESEKFNIQTIYNNSNTNENDSKKNNNVIVMLQNKKIQENNINNNLNNNNQISQQNIINNNINITNENFAKNLSSLNNNNIENKQKEFDDFEILDKSNVNNNVIQEKINCVKQSENSLTKKDNLYVNLER